MILETRSASSLIGFTPISNPQVDAGKPATILDVDDDSDTRLLFANILRFEGFNVMEAASGVEAVSLIEETDELDHVLLDLSLPFGDGHFVLEEISFLKKKRNFTICIVSASDSREDRCMPTRHN